LAFSKKKLLSALTESDLDKVADFIADYYVVNPLKSFLNVAFPNSGFTQPAFDKEPERRQDYVRRVARSYKANLPTLDEQCVFTGEPAVAIAFSDKEDFPQGRAFRQHIPMVTGEDVINFHPGGDVGLPVSGKALLCIQAFPLGCAKCGGKLLAVHSDNSRLIERFAAEFLRDNRAMIDIAREKGDSKLPERGSAKTLMIHTLLEIETKRQDAREEGRPYSVTAYHLSNSGQSNPLDVRNPPLEIYYLPLEIISFLEAITSVTYRTAWQSVERRAWQLTKEEVAARKETKGKKHQPKAKMEPVVKESRPRRNFLYEDLFNLPHNVPTFIRRYFLRLPARNAYDDDPRRSYSLKSDASLVSWQLTRLFLERIMQMTTTRIDRIREMGEQLAQYVHDENDTRFFQRFYSEQRRYDLIRNELIRVNNERLKRKQPPLVRFEPYVEVFEDVDDRGRTDWRLARDLVLIRMIEKLYELRWIEQHPDAIPDVRVEDEDDEKPAQ
jgi:CRISPR-associated protein Cst1